MDPAIRGAPRRSTTSAARSSACDTTDEIGAFLRDLCTAAEIEAMAHRLAAARLLDRGLPYHQVAERIGGSTTTVTRVAQWLRRGEGGYRLVLDRTASRPERWG